MKFKLTVRGLDCPNCAKKLATLMEKEDGVDSVKINFLSERLTVESALDESTLLSVLRRVARSFDSSVEIE